MEEKYEDGAGKMQSWQERELLARKSWASKVGQNFADEGCKCNGIKFRVSAKESHLIDFHDLKVIQTGPQGSRTPTKMDKIITMT